MSSVSTEVPTLRTNLADAPVTMALKEGRVASSQVQLNFCGPKLAHDGFKSMIREGGFRRGRTCYRYLLPGQGLRQALRHASDTGIRQNTAPLHRIQ